MDCRKSIGSRQTTRGGLRWAILRDGCKRIGLIDGCGTSEAPTRRRASGKNEAGGQQMV